MRVILLGAGASKCAGYPLAGELISEIKNEADGASRSLWNFTSAWNSWEGAVSRCTGLLGLLLRNPNPEVVLSVPDLFDAAWNSELRQNWTDYRRVNRGQIPEQEGAERVRARVRNARRFQELIIASMRFRDCLDMYFRSKHVEDSKKENRSRRQYLRRLLSDLRDGDTILTLNWDTTIERTLLEDGRWTPRDGYGFPKRLLCKADPTIRVRLPKSKIKVLKLHGSVGWYRSRQGRLYLDYDHGYLKYLGVPTSRGDILMFDPEAEIGGPNRDPVVAYPSFLKQLPGTELQEIWQAATRAVLTADSIEVWGYSLPESDIGVRVLLTPLRSRLSSRSVEVSVHDPSAEVGSRWKDFLGRKTRIDRRPLGCS